jgi:hypothetical protein
MATVGDSGAGLGIGGSLPIIGGLFTQAAEGAEASDQASLANQLAQEYGNINPAQFSSIQYTPQQLQNQSYAAPILAQAQQASVGNDANMQQQALQALQAQYTGYGQLQNQASMRNALQAANQQSQAQSGAVQQQMAARGMGNSLLAGVLQNQGAQSASNSMANAGVNAAAAMALNNLQGANAYSQGLSNLRGQDQSLAQYNTGIANQFNWNNAQLQNQTNQANTQLANQANQYNVGNNNAAFQYNQKRNDSNAQQTWQNAMANESAQANVLSQGQDQTNTQQNMANAQGATNSAYFDSLMGMGGGGGSGGGSSGGGMGGLMGSMGGMAGGM